MLEAKAEGIDPLFAKEQARKYARSKNCRFVILSNGNLHYFWDLERGNPYINGGGPYVRIGVRHAFVLDRDASAVRNHVWRP